MQPTNIKPPSLPIIAHIDRFQTSWFVCGVRRSLTEQRGKTRTSHTPSIAYSGLLSTETFSEVLVGESCSELCLWVQLGQSALDKSLKPLREYKHKGGTISLPPTAAALSD